MKPWLCAAGVQLRDQIDTWFPDRSTASPEGWLGDSRHSRTKSDHNPDKSGVVRAIDINARLQSSDSLAPYLADLCSKILNWKWRKYRGINPHRSHIHCSFTKAGDKDGREFDIPLLGGKI